MDLRALNIFIEVAEQKNFTRAAERLGYSQPTISFQIKQLEQELGAQLFDRIGHTVSLTDAGRDALPYAQQILHMSREMALGESRRKEPEGVIRLGLADSLCAPLIAAGFARFRAAYPKVSLQLQTAGTGELFRLLDHNEVDMVCTLDQHVYDTNYVIADEERIGVHFIVASSHPLAGRENVTIHDLMAYPFLLTEKGMSYRRLLDECLARQSLEIHPVLESGRADLLCQLAEQSDGISFLPDYVTEEAASAGKVQRIHVDGIHADVWKQLLYRRDKWVSPQMEAMVAHLSTLRVVKPC